MCMLISPAIFAFLEYSVMVYHIFYKIIAGIVSLFDYLFFCSIYFFTVPNHRYQSCYMYVYCSIVCLSLFRLVFRNTPFSLLKLHELFIKLKLTRTIIMRSGITNEIEGILAFELLFFFSAIVLHPEIFKLYFYLICLIDQAGNLLKGQDGSLLF